MKIIIAGGGKVGYSVAETLSAEGHDITVIDRDPQVIEHVSNTLDVICVLGTATSHETLRDAGAADADLLLAATQQDEVNMIWWTRKTCRCSASACAPISRRISSPAPAA